MRYVLSIPYDSDRELTIEERFRIVQLVTETVAVALELEGLPVRDPSDDGVSVANNIPRER